MTKLVATLFAAAALSGAAFADPVDHFTCSYTDGGHWWKTLALTVDYGAKTVDAPLDAGLEGLPDSVEITDATISWGVMRGVLTLDRKSGRLVWDMTAEYAYLEAIGQPPDEPEARYKGTMQCAVDGVKR